MPGYSRFSIEYLDNMAERRIIMYLQELLEGHDEIICDDDLGGAADQAQKIFEDHTSWSKHECIERAWKIATPVYESMKRNSVDTDAMITSESKPMEAEASLHEGSAHKKEA